MLAMATAPVGPVPESHCMTYPREFEPRIDQSGRYAFVWALLLATTALLSGCAVVDKDAEPEVVLGTLVSDKFMHRGMPQNRNGVMQGTMDTTLPTKWGDRVTIGTFANLDLNSSTGSAWFPGGHGGRVSQFDMIGTYAHSFDFGLDMTGGIHNYNVPFGESFPNGPRESTNELFVAGAIDFLGARPELRLHHDIDQAGGTYLRLGVSEPFPLDQEGLTVVLSGHLGWSSASQSEWNYGVAASGLADLQVSAALLYALDKNTMLGSSLSASTIVDPTIRDWFDQIGIEDQNCWIELFVSWSY